MSDSIDALRQEGNNAFKASDFKGAIAKYSEAIDVGEVEGSPDARLFCNRAICKLKIDDVVGLFTDSVQATDLDPAYSKAWVRQVTALETLKLYRLAAITACRGQFNSTTNADISNFVKLKDRNMQLHERSKKTNTNQTAIERALAKSQNCQRSCQELRRLFGGAETHVVGISDLLLLNLSMPPEAGQRQNRERHQHWLKNVLIEGPRIFSALTFLLNNAQGGIPVTVAPAEMLVYVDLLENLMIPLDEDVMLKYGAFNENDCSDDSADEASSSSSHFNRPMQTTAHNLTQYQRDEGFSLMTMILNYDYLEHTYGGNYANFYAHKPDIQSLNCEVITDLRKFSAVAGSRSGSSSSSRAGGDDGKKFVPFARLAFMKDLVDVEILGTWDKALRQWGLECADDVDVKLCM